MHREAFNWNEEGVHYKSKVVSSQCEWKFSFPQLWNHLEIILDGSEILYLYAGNMHFPNIFLLFLFSIFEKLF